MINCIIIEDQLPAQRVLKRYIEDSGFLNLIGAFTDALAALEVLKSQKIDLIFLDIHLPKLSGIDFLKTLPNPPQVILTTAFPDYALESYELSVVDYLLKPFSFQRFIKAVSKVQDTDASAKAITTLFPAEETINELFLKSGYDLIKVNVAEIYFIRSDADYTEVHLKDKKHLSAETLRYWEGKLGEKIFFRSHRSYIVNFTKIHKVSGSTIFLENNIKIPLGRAYKNDFLEQFVK